MFFIGNGKSLMGNIFTMCCGSIDPPFDRKVRSVIDPLVLSPDHEESERMKRILKKRFVFMGLDSLAGICYGFLSFCSWNLYKL